MLDEIYKIRSIEFWTSEGEIVRAKGTLSRKDKPMAQIDLDVERDPPIEVEFLHELDQLQIDRDLRELPASAWPGEGRPTSFEDAMDLFLRERLEQAVEHKWLLRRMRLVPGVTRYRLWGKGKTKGPWREVQEPYSEALHARLKTEFGPRLACVGVPGVGAV